jgi:hypothetical protein
MQPNRVPLTGLQALPSRVLDGLFAALLDLAPCPGPALWCCCAWQPVTAVPFPCPACGVVYFTAQERTHALD